MIKTEEYNKALYTIKQYKKQNEDRRFRLAKLMAIKLNQSIKNCYFRVIQHYDYEGEYSYEITRIRNNIKHYRYKEYTKKENVLCGGIIEKYGYKKDFYNFWIQ